MAITYYNVVLSQDDHEDVVINRGVRGWDWVGNG